MDKEKVIKGLNYCTHTDGAECPNCPYWQDDDCVEVLNTDVIALLKEQEAMNVDAFVQWCIDSHIMGDATVRGIKYWVGKYKEIKEGR